MLPAGPHDNLTAEQLVKAQTLVSAARKDRIGSVFPTRGIHSFLIQHAYENVANFIESNNFTYLDKHIVAQYIAGGFRDPRKQPDPEPVADSGRRVNGSGTPGADEASPSPSDLGARTQKSPSRRVGGAGRGRGGKKGEED